MDNSLVPVVTSMIAVVCAAITGVLAFYGKKSETNVQREAAQDESTDRLLQRLENENKRLLEQIDRKDIELNKLHSEVETLRALLMRGGRSS